MWGVHLAVGGENLAEGEVGGQELILEANIVSTKAPAEIPWLKGETEWKNTPYQGIIHAGNVSVPKRLDIPGRI